MADLDLSCYQRIQIIVISYNLAGYDEQSFETYLHALMGRVPLLLLELAIVETLIKQWLRIPFERGVQFLEQTQNLLSVWQSGQFECHLTPGYFELVTGLDPDPVFDSLEQVLCDWISAAARVRATVQIPATEIP
jgi:hypothetical protein